jgi:two-component system response regulator HydG
MVESEKKWVDVKDGRILVVDDEEGLRHTFVLFLQRAGFRQVLEADSFAAAKVLLDEGGFDLVISDIVLGNFSGIDLLRLVRKMYKNCPVVMVTGYPNIETAAEAVRLGAYDYLAKPVKKDALLGVTQRALEKCFSDQQKRVAKQEILKQLDWRKSVLNSAPSMITVINRQMTVVECNELARAWFSEYLPQLREGRRIEMGKHPLLDSLVTECRRVMETGIIGEKRIEWRKEEGDRFAVFVMTVAPLTSGLGPAGGVVITAYDEVASLLASDDRENGLHQLCGSSTAMTRLYFLIRNVAPVDSAVLITGESGCGKGLVADAVHRESKRAAKVFVKVDCAALSDELLESELFGHSRGAFTGADSSRPGRILQAEGGTLFLDEIGDISTKMQLRLLRFLQEKMFYPVGRDQPVKVDVRVVAATNVDLQEKIKQGKFREDLFFRLRVVELNVPPLRQRREDIVLLAEQFLGIACKKMEKRISGFSSGVLRSLNRYSWPGNVRELEHVIERAVVLCDGSVVDSHLLPKEIVDGEEQVNESPAGEPEVISGNSGETETQRLILALRLAGGNKAKAARQLGMDRSTLYRKLQTLGIDSEHYDAEKRTL